MPTTVLSETEKFDEFRRRRDDERAQAKARRISQRQGVLRFSEAGYGQIVATVFRLGDTEIRGYIRTLDGLQEDGSFYEYGDVFGDNPTKVGATRKFDEAKKAVSARLRDRASSDSLCGGDQSDDGRPGTARSDTEGGRMATTTAPKRGSGKTRGSQKAAKAKAAAKKKTAAVTETTPKPEAAKQPDVDLVALRKEIVAAIKSAVSGVEVKSNKDGRFDRFLVGGKGFVLVFKPTKSGVPLQIPRPLLGKINPTKASGFKEVKWGFSRTVKTSSEIDATVKAIVLAADAVRPKETTPESK